MVSLTVALVVAAGGWFWLRRTRAAYKEACIAAYYGTLDRVTGSARLNTARISEFRRTDPPEWLRVKDARRWARWLTFCAAIYTLVLACSACTTTLVSFRDAGLVTTAGPWTGVALTSRVFGQVAWTLVNSIPVLDLPGSLHWADPAAFRGSLIVDVTLLIARVAVFGPIIAWIVGVCRASEFDPRQPISTDPVVNHVVVGLLDFKNVPVLRMDSSISAIDRWDYAFEFASRQLGAGWTPGRVREHLAGVPPRSIW